jgi:hypothetical protein
LKILSETLFKMVVAAFRKPPVILILKNNTVTLSSKKYLSDDRLFFGNKYEHKRKLTINVSVL